jgi:hypothetical protein
MTNKISLLEDMNYVAVALGYEVNGSEPDKKVYISKNDKVLVIMTNGDYCEPTSDDIEFNVADYKCFDELLTLQLNAH